MKLLRNILFYRVAAILSALVIQLLVFITMIIKFSDYFAFFYGLSLVVSLVIVLLIINNDSNPAYKIAWIVLILLFPIFGGLFYVFFGGNKLSKRMRRKMKAIDDLQKKALEPRDHVLAEIGASNENAANQARYIRDYAFFPPSRNSTAEYLPVGEIKFEKLKEELKKAKRYIFLEYFIIEEGVMWNSILDILVEKVKQGVDVRVIYDDIGCLFKLPYRYDKRLEQMGIKCSIFNPLIPILSPRINNRNHRKIAIIDGVTGFTGGINLADEYINEYERFGHWKDAAIMIKGEAVWNMTVMFLSMWDYLRGINEDFRSYKAQAAENYPMPGDGYLQPFADNPLDDEPVGEIVYLNLIQKARRYVYITTPYLVISNEMMTALSSAAKAGVDVRIITPHHPDKWYVYEVNQSYYKFLIKSGVAIYEYTPGFIHSKTFVADDEYGIVGTINLDYRSFYLHFECGVWMYKNSSILAMKNDFIDTLKECKRISMEDVINVKWYRKIGRLVLRVFAPLM